MQPTRTRAQSLCLAEVDGRAPVAADVRPQVTRRSPAQYEEFIGDLVANLRLRHDVYDIAHGPKNRLRGASGVMHQIDVSFSEQADGQAKLVVFECKSLRTGRAINLGHVKVLKATSDDLKQSHEGHCRPLEAHLVSSVPLQAGAAKYARHYGIHAHLVGDGGNWGFKYGSVAQFGLQLQGAGAIVTGTATIHRRCEACANLFKPAAAEQLCVECSAQRAA